MQRAHQCVPYLGVALGDGSVEVEEEPARGADRVAVLVQAPCGKR